MSAAPDGGALASETVSRDGISGDNRTPMATIYVTGHRNPDADSIASAIGYAELKGRLDTRNAYVPVRLGEVNAQTRWLLDRSGAAPPQFLPHVMVRACDVMQSNFPIAKVGAPIREAGLEMARAGLELVPVVDDDGALVGVVTERALARRFIRETREASTLRDAPTNVSRDRRRARRTTPDRRRQGALGPRVGAFDGSDPQRRLAG